MPTDSIHNDAFGQEGDSSQPGWQVLSSADAPQSNSVKDEIHNLRNCYDCPVEISPCGRLEFLTHTGESVQIAVQKIEGSTL